MPKQRTHIEPSSRLHPSDAQALAEKRQRITRETAQRVKDILSTEKPIREQLMLKLGEEFLDTAELADEDRLRGFIEGGFPINWQQPRTGQTALHIVAGIRARQALRLLLRTNALNFLIRDHQGRLASEMAYLYGNDVALARLLESKERKQAEAQGITLTRRP